MAAPGDRAVGVDADVTVVAGIQQPDRAAVECSGGLGMWADDAGSETSPSVLDSTEADDDEVMAIGLRSTFLGPQVAARWMIPQGDDGRINMMADGGLNQSSSGL